MLVFTVEELIVEKETRLLQRFRREVLEIFDGKEELLSWKVILTY